jgi:shikimate kinase
MTIPQIFARYGEEEFRKRESDCLYRASLMVDAVIATGGGAPMYRNAMERMRSTGMVVFLHASIPTVIERLGTSDVARPLLAKSGASIEQVLSETLAHRERIYRLADCVVQTDEKSVAEIAEEVLQAYREWTATGS